MKRFTLALCASALLSSFPVLAISPDEIVAKYLDNTGGLVAWKKLNGVKITAEGVQGPMKFPTEIVQLKDGRTYSQFEVQGKVIKQNVFDGSNLWSTNFMTMKAEAADAESTANFKLTLNDFPNDFVDYKAKGYKLELIGEESIEGTEAYKLKLTKEPNTVDGRQVDDVVFYYFDKENFVPMVQESEIMSGPAKGKIGVTKLSEYQEVNGLFFPFSISQGTKEQVFFQMNFKKVELNPTVDGTVFAMPAAQ